MADQNKKGDDAQSSKSANRGQSSESNQNTAGEPDDVAEDRNLSGASTWLNLPDQPAGEMKDEEEPGQSDKGGSSNRDSKR
jgi:hypothetical protein